VFNTAESSFLAGYLAAGMSKTKKVGTFGGAKIPTVTIFMDGFSQGVDYYNKQKEHGREGPRLGCCQAGRPVHRRLHRHQRRPAYGAGLDQPGC
jgi:basic membrane lipoprotein Med (substrate-binding protein (PBP1-ABC) superfamily)